MAINKRAGEMYIVLVGQYADEYPLCVADEFAQAKTVRDDQNRRVEEGSVASDMVARIETITAWRKGQKVKL